MLRLVPLPVVLTLVGTGCTPALPVEGPVQPIAFSHQLHAGELEVDCRYCHSRVDRAPEANLPAVRTCVGCHLGIKDPSAGVGLVAGHFERREPIAWSKVNDLPDHVRFHHGAHVRAGVACEHCHGPVSTLERMRQAQRFDMAWCVDCHRSEGAGRDCLVCHK